MVCSVQRSLRGARSGVGVVRLFWRLCRVARGRPSVEEKDVMVRLGVRKGGRSVRWCDDSTGLSWRSRAGAGGWKRASEVRRKCLGGQREQRMDSRWWRDVLIGEVTTYRRGRNNE